MRLEVMFLLETEIEPVMDSFAVKFSDILSRRRVLFGPDPFANLTIPQEAIRRRTIQVLLNCMLRMRERYALCKPARGTVDPRRSRCGCPTADMCIISPCS